MQQDGKRLMLSDAKMSHMGSQKGNADSHLKANSRGSFSSKRSPMQSRQKGPGGEINPLQ